MNCLKDCSSISTRRTKGFADLPVVCALVSIHLVFTAERPKDPNTGTEGVKEALPGFSKQMSGKLRSLEEGSDTIVWLALEDPCNLTPGGFYFDRKLQVA